MIDVNIKSRATAVMSLPGLFSNVSDLLVGVPYVCKGQWQFREICDLEFPSINPDFPVGWIRLEIILTAKGRTLRFRLATVIFVARENRNILSGSGHLCPIPFTGPINHKNVTQWQGEGGGTINSMETTTMYTTTKFQCVTALCWVWRILII